MKILSRSTPLQGGDAMLILVHWLQRILWLAIAVGFMCSTARADTFDFTISMNASCGNPIFIEIFGACNPIEAHGVLMTGPPMVGADATQGAPPCIGSGFSFKFVTFYEVESIHGEINGSSINFVQQAPEACTGQITNIGPGNHQNFDFLSFTAGGQSWSIQPAPDSNPYVGFGIFDLLTGESTLITLSITPVPEPDGWLTMATGLAAMIALARFGRQRNHSSA
jgi:hypothetical protein